MSKPFYTTDEQTKLLLLNDKIASGYDNDAFRWTLDWLNNPNEQITNPLILYSDNVDECIDDIKVNNDLQVAFIVKKIVNNSKIHVTHFGDYFMGITSNNLDNILECKIVMNQVELSAPFMFDEKYTSFTVDKNSGDRLQFYYNPELKIIPLAAIGFCYVCLDIKLKDPQLQTEIDIIYGFCSRPRRNKLIRSSYAINYKRDPKSTVNQNDTLIISDGTCGYRNFSIPFIGEDYCVPMHGF